MQITANTITTEVIGVIALIGIIVGFIKWTARRQSDLNTIVQENDTTFREL